MPRPSRSPRRGPGRRRGSARRPTRDGSAPRRRARWRRAGGSRPRTRPRCAGCGAARATAARTDAACSRPCGVADESGVLPQQLLQRGARERPGRAPLLAGVARWPRRAGVRRAGARAGADAARRHAPMRRRRRSRRRRARRTRLPRAASWTPGGSRRARRCGRPRRRRTGRAGVVRPVRSVDDAAHQVVGGRRHRDRIARPVETPVAHGPVDRREPAREELAALLVRRPEAGRVEEDGTSALRLHLVRDRPGDDVARRELAVGVGVEREAPAVLVDEGRALAADGLGHEERVPARVAGGVSLPSRTVGWNWKNSRSATSAPARIAAAMPSPVATGGFVEWAYSSPAPPVASTTASASTTSRTASSTSSSTPRARDRRPVTTMSIRNACSMTRTSLARRRATSAFSIAVPVASPPEWRIRG